MFLTMCSLRSQFVAGSIPSRDGSFVCKSLGISEFPRFTSFADSCSRICDYVFLMVFSILLHLKLEQAAGSNDFY